MKKSKNEFTRYAFLSEYGIGAFLFRSKETAEIELKKINHHGNIKIVKVKVKVMVMVMVMVNP